MGRRSFLLLRPFANGWLQPVPYPEKAAALVGQVF